ncbi:MAG: M48 family metallopeptidase [Verrucomicrobiota bacterium]
MTSFALTALLLVAAKCAAEIWLEALNQRSVRANASQVPEAFRGVVDDATYAKSVEYTQARSRFGQFESVYDAAVLAVVLVCGVLPGTHGWFLNAAGSSAWWLAAWLFAVGVMLAATSLPLNWHAQFHLEQRFGFNTSTPRLWIADRVKGLLLAAVLGYPLLVLILKLFEWMGALWWLWAWAALLGFQLLMVALAPTLILPLFNKFTALPEGTLRERLLALGARTGFHARTIQVMDGSKRSRHSNAFFTGFGRFRQIVLFDTLMQQLSETELEAVLAHEIGHYKRRHVPKMLAWSAASSLVAFYVLAWLAGQGWFYEAFGFAAGNVAPALLLFGLLSGVVTFWFSPVAHWWSRKFEYEADAYAAVTMKETKSLIGALRKLSEKNLSNLTPHPWYSGFYYSHPTLVERERALAKADV